jgi:hypothetical protein
MFAATIFGRNIQPCSKQINVGTDLGSKELVLNLSPFRQLAPLDPVGNTITIFAKKSCGLSLDSSQKNCVAATYHISGLFPAH